MKKLQIRKECFSPTIQAALKEYDRLRTRAGYTKDEAFILLEKTMFLSLSEIALIRCYVD